MSTASVPFGAASVVRRRPPAAVRRQRFLVAVANHSLLIAAAITFLAPFAFILLTALMTNNQALSSHLWPHPFRWQNFADVFHQAPILRWTFNTMTYSVLATLGLIVSSVPVAYALSRLRWRGRNVAFMIVLLRQFFLTIPEEYLDAARVDGCGELRILTTVVLRMAKPAIAAVALFSFLYTFNDFFLPLLYTGENPARWPL